MKSLYLLVAPLLALNVAPAAAQDQPSPRIDIGQTNTNRDTLTIGGGVSYLPSYQGSNDYVVAPAIAARGTVHGISFFTRGSQLFVDLVPSPAGPRWSLSAGPVLSLDLNRVGRLVDRQVTALGTRRIALEAGGYVGFAKTGVITSDFDSLSFRLSYVHDLGDVHGSYIVTPAIDYTTPLSRKVLVGLSLSADYAGAGYASTYYDVDAAGAVRSGLPQFQAHKGWQDITAGAVAGFALSGDLRHGFLLVLTGSYSRMKNDFAASPVTRIAGSADQFFGGIGLGYTF